jgi:hypothetical protein
MKTLILSLLALIGFMANGYAQNLKLSPVTLPTQGQHTKAGNFTLSWTMGQVVNLSARNGNLLLTPGFQQPDFTNLFVDATVIHKSSTHGGGIFLSVTGGIAPYKFEWSNDIPFSIDTIYDSIVNIVHVSGLDTTGIREVLSNQLQSNDRVGLDTGSYTVRVLDSRGYGVPKSYRIGNVAKFLVTENTLQNDTGTVSKIGVTGWGGNACLSYYSITSESEASFEFQVLDTGSFDFGCRDIPPSLLSDSLVFATPLYSYSSEEYYQIRVSNKSLNYYAGNTDSVTNISPVDVNDRISMIIKSSSIVVKKNNDVVLIKPRSSLLDRNLYTLARIYNYGSAFKIIENIVY